MVSIVQVQANCSCFGSIVFALFWLYTASAAPAALQIHTVFRFPDLGRDTACRQFKPGFYIPLLARGIERSAARYDLPRRPHAGLGTYPRVPYVSTPHGTQGFGDRRAVLVILSCAGTRRISQHRIACSARMTRRAREKLWLPLCLMQLWGHIPPSAGRTRK